MRYDRGYKGIRKGTLFSLDQLVFSAEMENHSLRHSKDQMTTSLNSSSSVVEYTEFDVVCPYYDFVVSREYVPLVHISVERKPMWLHLLRRRV
jgi:hypothetical protein